MEKTKIDKNNEDRAALMALFSGLFGLILYFTFRKGFSIDSSIAIFFAILITYLAGYPLFIRGGENRWTRDKRQWKFSHWLIFSVLAAVIVFALSELIGVLLQMMRSY